MLIVQSDFPLSNNQCGCVPCNVCREIGKWQVFINSFFMLVFTAWEENNLPEMQVKQNIDPR